MLYDNWSLLPLPGQRNHCQSRCASTTTFHSGAEKKRDEMKLPQKFLSVCLQARQPTCVGGQLRLCCVLKTGQIVFALLLFCSLFCIPKEEFPFASNFQTVNL